MTLIWKPQALVDRENIMDFIAMDNPVAAVELDEIFSNKAVLLLDNPKLGRIGRINGTRELVAHPNFIFVYRAAGRSVTVLRVLHAAQQWPPIPASE